MKNIAILSSLILIFIPSFIFSQGKIEGYLSFEYRKDQRQSEVSHGTFQNAQFGLVFSGEISNRFNYISEVRLKEEARIDIEQALLEFRSSDVSILKLGLYLVPFGKYNQSNRPHQTMLIKAPLHVESMFPARWRDMGFLLEGKFSGFFYSVYLGNGLSEGESLNQSQQFNDNNKNKGKGGRVGLALSHDVEVGYSYYRGKYDEENRRDLTLQGIDVAWFSEGFQFLSEYSKANLQNPTDFNAGEAEGYFFQVSFDMGNFRPVVSYQKLKYNDSYHGIGFVSNDSHGEGISEEKSCWTVGFVYFLTQNVFLKFEYDFSRDKNLELKNNSLAVQVALSF